MNPETQSSKSQNQHRRLAGGALASMEKWALQLESEIKAELGPTSKPGAASLRSKVLALFLENDDCRRQFQGVAKGVFEFKISLKGCFGLR